MAPAFLADTTEDVTQKGRFPVKKVAVRAAAVAGGLVAMLLAGGAAGARFG